MEGEFKNENLEETRLDVKENVEVVNADSSSSSSSSESSDDESPKSAPDAKKDVEVVNLEELENENEGLDYVVKSTDPIVPITENLSPNMDIKVDNINIPIVTDLGFDEIKDKCQTLPTLDEKTEFCETVEEAMPVSDGGDSSNIVNLVPRSNTDDAEMVQISSEEVEDRHVQPIISMPLSARQKTSWTSCCGIFDLLRPTRT